MQMFGNPGYVYAIYGRVTQDGERVQITDWDMNRDRVSHRLEQFRADDLAEGITWGDFEIKCISADWLA